MLLTHGRNVIDSQSQRMYFSVSWIEPYTYLCIVQLNTTSILNITDRGPYTSDPLY